MIFAPKKKKITYEYIDICNGKIHKIRQLIYEDGRAKAKGIMYIEKKDLSYQLGLIVE